MLPVVLSYVPAIIGLLAVGALTWLKNPRDPINIFFGLFSLSTGAWLACLFLGDILLSPTGSLWALRVGVAVGTPISLFFLWFSQKFPVEKKSASKAFYILTAIPAVVFIFLAPTNLIIPSVELRDNSAQVAQLGLLYTLNSAYLIGGIVAGFFVLFRKMSSLNSKQRAQTRLVVIGFVVALIVNILTGFILAMTGRGTTFSNLAGALSMLFFAVFTSYTIIRHRLFDIRLAIVRTVGFLVTSGFVGGVYTVLILGIGAPIITDGQVSLAKNRTSLLLLVPPTLLIAFTFHSIQSYIARVTRRVFYQDLYDLRQVLDSFSDELIASNEIEKIMEKSLRALSDAIKPLHAYFVTFDDHGGAYKQIVRHTQAPDSMSELVGDIKLIKDNPVVREELKTLPRSFDQNDIFLALRLGLKDRPVGIILFGPKQNGRAYTTQDIALLRISAKNLTIALENAKHYDQISHFAETLRAEVLKATAELRSANKELKTLDTMKDDFISMASHQLRTPATSVHEALQMMNHSDVKLNADEKKRLAELAEASSEHLVNVVADMLSISRIQAGHFTITKAPGDLLALADKVIKQTAVLAEQKRIVVDFQKPSTAISVDFDTPKMNEAISNYVENAIKYSGEGTTVTVKVRIENERLHFEVADQGMGVPEAERKNLFGKFFRAGNARTLQPDGNGIGLFVVKSIAEGHGGDAYYQPLEPGSLFGFWLPLNPSTDPTKQDIDNKQRKKS